MQKHLRHVLLLVAAIAMLAMLGMSLTVWSVLGVFAICLVAVEGGLWIIHRRDRNRTPPAHGRAGTA